MVCKFYVDASGASLTCSACGASVPYVNGNVFRQCDSEASEKPGLGDMVAAGLSAIGITKERVSKAVGGDCGCSKRQEQLNELGRKIGIG